MSDKEKVIKGLEICLKNIDQQDCPDDCPYLSDCSKYENRVIFQPLMRDALAMLKEQEAKLPRKITKIGGLMNGICPNILCNAEINSISNEMACGYCGQAVKWDA